MYFLSWDIHCGGVAELIRIREGKISYIPHIVSSPIAYYPMPAAVEALSSSKKEQTIVEREGVEFKGRNITFIPERNYLKFYPEKDHKNLEFIFEEYSDKVQFDSSFH